MLVSTTVVSTRLFPPPTTPASRSLPTTPPFTRPRLRPHHQPQPPQGLGIRYLAPAHPRELPIQEIRAHFPLHNREAPVSYVLQQQQSQHHVGRKAGRSE